MLCLGISCHDKALPYSMIVEIRISANLFELKLVLAQNYSQVPRYLWLELSHEMMYSQLKNKCRHISILVLFPNLKPLTEETLSMTSFHAQILFACLHASFSAIFIFDSFTC